MISRWAAITSACQISPASIAAKKTNDSASVSASCDSVAGTFSPRRNLKGLTPNMQIAIPTPSLK
jgi:hypothetical protein